MRIPELMPQIRILTPVSLVPPGPESPSVDSDPLDTTTERRNLRKSQRLKIEGLMRAARPNQKEGDVLEAVSVEIDRLDRIPALSARTQAFEALIAYLQPAAVDMVPSPSTASSAKTLKAPPCPQRTDSAGYRMLDGVLLDSTGAPADEKLGSSMGFLMAKQAVRFAPVFAATGLDSAMADAFLTAAQEALKEHRKARQVRASHAKALKASPPPQAIGAKALKAPPPLQKPAQLSPLAQLVQTTNGFLALVVAADQPQVSPLAREHRSEELIDVLLPPNAGTSVGVYERSAGPQLISARGKFLDDEGSKFGAYDLDRFGLIPFSLDDHEYLSLEDERRTSMLAGLLRPPHRFTSTPEVHAGLFGFDGLRTSELKLIDSLIEDDVESTLWWTDRNARGLPFEDLLFGKHRLPRDRSETDVFRPEGRTMLSSWKDRPSQRSAPEGSFRSSETDFNQPAPRLTRASRKVRLAKHPLSADAASMPADDEAGNALPVSADQEEAALATSTSTNPPPLPPASAYAPPVLPIPSTSTTPRPLPPHLAPPPTPDTASSPPTDHEVHSLACSRGLVSLPTLTYSLLPSSCVFQPAPEPSRSSAAGSSSGPSSVPQTEPMEPSPPVASPVAPTRSLDSSTTAAPVATVSMLAVDADAEAAAIMLAPRSATSGDTGTKSYLWRWESPKVRQTLGRKAFPSPRRRSSSSSMAAQSAAFPGGQAAFGHYIHRSTLKMREMVVERHRAHARLLAWSRDIGVQRVAQSSVSASGRSRNMAAAWKRLGVPERNLNKVDVGHEVY